MESITAARIQVCRTTPVVIETSFVCSLIPTTQVLLSFRHLPKKCFMFRLVLYTEVNLHWVWANTKLFVVKSYAQEVLFFSLV